TGSLKITERGRACGVEQRVDGGVRVLRRMVDLQDVVHCGDAVVEVAQTAVELVDVDVLRPVHRGECQQDEFEVGGASARRAGAVVDEDPVGQEAAQRGLELVVGGI